MRGLFVATPVVDIGETTRYVETNTNPLLIRGWPNLRIQVDFESVPPLRIYDH